MTGTWRIEAKRLPIAEGIPIADGIFGHLYVQVFNDQNKLINEFDGLATSRTEKYPNSNEYKVYPVGVPWHSIRLKETTGGASPWHKDETHQSLQLFSGTQSEVESAMDSMRAFGEYLDVKDYNYFPLGFPSYNSNSVFSALVDVMQTVINIPESVQNTAKNMSLSNPGSDRQLVTNGDWKAYLDAPYFVPPASTPLTPAQEALADSFNVPYGAIINKGTFANGNVYLNWSVNDNLQVRQTGTVNANNKLTLMKQVETYGRDDGSTFTLSLTHDQFDVKNKPTDVPDLSLKLPSATYTANLIGTTFGSQLGALLGGDSLFQQIGARTLGSLIGAEIGDKLGNAAVSLLGASSVTAGDTLLEDIVEGAMSDAGKTITGAFEAQSFSALGSLLVAELADALNINGFEGQILTATGGTVTGTLLNNVYNVAVNNAATSTISNGFNQTTLLKGLA